MALIVGASLQCGIRLPDAAVADPGQRNANRQDRKRKDQQQLCCSRKPREPLGETHRPARFNLETSAELADEIEEIVGDRFTKRIVVDRAERTAEIGRPLLAHTFIGRLRFARALGVRRFVRLAGLPRTQPLVPLTRVQPRLIQISLGRATASNADSKF